MSATAEVVQYMMNVDVQVMLPDGSQCNGPINLYFTPTPGSTTMTDAVVLGVQQGLLAAFPPSWGLTNVDMQIAKTDQTTVTYATDYTSTPPSFS
jgi:hypothetical protein